MIIKSTELFTKRKNKLYPKRDIRIGGVTVYKGHGVPKGGITYMDMIQQFWKNNLEIQLDGNVFVITGIY